MSNQNQTQTDSTVITETFTKKVSVEDPTQLEKGQVTNEGVVRGLMTEEIEQNGYRTADGFVKLDNSWNKYRESYSSVELDAGVNGTKELKTEREITKKVTFELEGYDLDDKLLEIEGIGKKTGDYTFRTYIKRLARVGNPYIVLDDSMPYKAENEVTNAVSYEIETLRDEAVTE